MTRYGVEMKPTNRIYSSHFTQFLSIDQMSGVGFPFELSGGSDRRNRLGLIDFSRLARTVGSSKWTILGLVVAVSLSIM